MSLKMIIENLQELDLLSVGLGGQIVLKQIGRVLVAMMIMMMLMVMMMIMMIMMTTMFRIYTM